MKFIPLQDKPFSWFSPVCPANASLLSTRDRLPVSFGAVKFLQLIQRR